MEMKKGASKEKVVKLGMVEKGIVECKCKELEERRRKAEERCLVLGLEIERIKVEKEALRTVIAALKMEKLGIENELWSLKREHEEKVDLNKKREEENRVLNLMIKNNALESEKIKAEKEVEEWQKKFKEMESLVLLMEEEDRVLSKNGVEVNNSMNSSGSMKKVANLEFERSLQESGTPYNGTPHECLTSVKKQKSDGHVNFGMERIEEIQKNLVFEEDEQLRKKTPSSASPASINIIDVPDSDDDDEHDFAKIRTTALDRAIVKENKVQGNGEQHSGATINRCKENVSVVSASKRKRLVKVVTSDVDSDVDENTLISDLIKLPRHPEVILDQASSEVKDCPVIATPNGSGNVSTKKLQQLRRHEEKGEKEKCTSREILDENSKELESHNGSHSLSRTIIDDDKLKDVSRNADNREFKESIYLAQKNKTVHSKWKFEGEGHMLAVFSRDAGLCMKAVCALYRQQKAKQVQKGINQQGFNQTDDFRGSALAKFLTGGDPQSDVKKSVKELREYDREGVDVCRKLSIRYSKQLFEIYEKKQDPYFLP